ncbi:DUF559 domain-containing protein [Gordonia sp. PDNC005]|uniref:endonuclease domain-containing protein n=1 Tax=unclassified Gordonia (in: high G+C Gram-positive bacteria) TaxID=2657482 RepID=UPI0019642EEF|nr:DUF559 domain-containing protein [Gordonia sp. PDNC005]QRY61250.1 DUF559 domain-containing protein [Gordonia sp. PDNC005]
MRDSGVYPAAELIALGFDRETIRRAVLSGDLAQLRWGWFAAANHDARTASAVRDGGVLTCVDALRFHELWTPPGHNGLHLRRSRNLSGKNPACRPPTGCVRSAREPVDPLPVALLYAVGCLPLDEWVAVCDSYLNSTGTDVSDLLAAMGRPGPEVLRRLRWVDRRSQSGTESIVRVRLRSAGFDVVVQPPVEGVGHADLRVGRLLVECDSVLHHASRADYERDHHRDRRAVVDGWLVLRLTYDDILYDWDGVLADILSITRPDRHRARTPQAIEMIQKSVLQSQLEGNIPSVFDLSTEF